MLEQCFKKTFRWWLKKTGLNNGYVYDFSVNYDSNDVDDI